MLQEIQVRGGLKKRPHPSGVCGFFLEKPINFIYSSSSLYTILYINSIVHESQFFLQNKCRNKFCFQELRVPIRCTSCLGICHVS